MEPDSTRTEAPLAGCGPALGDRIGSADGVVYGPRNKTSMRAFRRPRPRLLTGEPTKSGGLMRVEAADIGSD